MLIQSFKNITDRFFLWGRLSSASISAGKEDENILKGSCRSDGVTDLVALMERAGDAFASFGGHKMSGGFEVDFEKIHTLEDALVKASTHVVKKKRIF